MWERSDCLANQSFCLFATFFFLVLITSWQIEWIAWLHNTDQKYIFLNINNINMNLFLVHRERFILRIFRTITNERCFSPQNATSLVYTAQEHHVPDKTSVEWFWYSLIYYAAWMDRDESNKTLCLINTDLQNVKHTDLNHVKSTVRNWESVEPLQGGRGCWADLKWHE